MSTELQEIITDSSIRSFNQGYACGKRETEQRFIELLEALIKEIKGETK